jgi:UDP-2,3-diacylglucosamine pyrophosphatase LpxH
MSGTGFRRVVVLSDFHFGDDGALLAREDVVEGLIAELRTLGDIDKLVLLGDVWDLWRTGLTSAVRAGTPFFRALASWDGPREVILVAGNHDYHLKTFSEERRRRGELGWEETGDDIIVLTGDRVVEVGTRRVEGLTLRLRYPLVCLEVRGKTVLLMHGHHLDFFSRSFWWAKTSWLARWVLGASGGITISDLDRLNKPFFEFLTVTAHVPELVAREYRFYYLLRSLAKLLRFESGKGASPRRYTTVEQNIGEAVDLLGKLLPGYIPDLFVFGHTHRAGFSRVRVGERGVLLANSGCWLDDSGNEAGGTYLVIEDGVRLRHLGEWEASMEI